MLCRQQQQLSVACTLPQHSDAEKLTNVFPGIWTWALTAVITTGGNTARTLARKTNNIYTLAKAAAFSTYIFPLVVVVAASSAQRSQSTICSHCDYTYIHAHSNTHKHRVYTRTNAHKRVNIKVCITCFSSYFRLRVFQTAARPVCVRVFV